jgi:metal-dependent amidase/aminoacylase/carboxypeptidase family protein
MFEVTESLLAEVREFRKELHRIPEVAGHEFETCAAIRKKLAELSTAPSRFTVHLEAHMV